jgi:chemotaxis protein CheX
MMPGEEAICEITRDVFALFGYSTQTIAASSSPREVSCSVAIDGPTKAIVEVRLAMDLAGHLTNAMLGEGSAESKDLVRDLAGELANMIGGNVKGLFPGPSTLSIPKVEIGKVDSDAPAELPKTTLSFECEVGTFEVTITLTGQAEEGVAAA